MSRLQEHYKQTVVPTLMEQFNYKSIMQVPKITKNSTKILSKSTPNLETNVPGDVPEIT